MWVLVKHPDDLHWPSENLLPPLHVALVNDCWMEPVEAWSVYAAMNP